MNALERRWYQSPALVLLPIEAFYRAVVAARRSAYRWGVFSSTRLDVPVIVVGNINVGGTGKTPLTIWLVKYLKEAGYQPGIITRGYGGKATSWPQTVAADSDPALVGDEPVIMARRCDCPVVAGPDRVRAAKVLLANSACNILISDDGMQHYRLQRDLEIVVVDGERRFGNNHCLPAGPLREPVKRLKEVDYIVTNGNARTGEWCMSLVQEGAISLADASSVPLSDFKGQAVHAVAGIGNPARFFNQLRAQGIKVIEHAFPDHHPYVADDIQFDDSIPVLMTEKDAVKCQRFGCRRHWYIPVEACLDQGFALALLETTRKMDNG